MSKHAPGFVALVDDAKTRIREASVEDVLAWRDDGIAFVLVDVREDGEWEVDRAAGAVHLGKGILERDVEAAYGSDARLVLYCGGGCRSALAADALQKMGYTDVWSMAGGIKRWRAVGAPTESGS